MLAYIQGTTTISQGSSTNSSATFENDLIQNAMKMPVVQEWIDRVDQRNYITRITTAPSLDDPSFATGDYDSRFKPVKVGAKIADNAFRFSVQGRINQNSVIIAQVGQTQPDGTFQLILKDKLIYQGKVALFHGQGFQARCVTYSGTAGNYTYTFKSPDGRLFDWNTHVSGQTGAKTCMGIYTSYSEGSEKGHSRLRMPDTFITHTTIQRAQYTATGDVLSDKLWYKFDGGLKGTAEGWMPRGVANVRKNFAWEDELQKLFGISNMKNADGTLKAQAPTDANGNPIISGDGIIPQIEGGNHIIASGTDSMPTIDDFGDLMQNIVLKGNTVSGREIAFLTGTVGYRHTQILAPTLAKIMNVQYFMDITKVDTVGGAKGPAGIEFMRLDFFGNTVHFFQHPMMDDSQLFTEVNSMGLNVMSATYFALTLEEKGNPDKNIEIMAKGNSSYDRANISTFIGGMTGGAAEAKTTFDGDTYSFLKQDLTVVRLTSLCGIIEPGS